MHRNLRLGLAAIATAFVAVTGVSMPATADEMVLISTHTRNFVGEAPHLNNILFGVVAESKALVVDRIQLDGDKVAFRARNGKFVRAGVGQQTYLAAASDHIRSWETFEIVRLSAAKFAIRSVQNGLYVQLGEDGRLAAVSQDVGSRETFSSKAAEPAVNAAVPGNGGNPANPGNGNGNAGNGNANAGNGANPGGNGGNPNRPGWRGNELAGDWRIAHVRTFDGSLVAMAPSVRHHAYIRVRQDGRMSASTGCNDITGRVRAERALVSFGDVASTKMLCLSDAGTMELLLMIAFDHASRFASVGNELRFYDRNGDPVMVLRTN